MAAKEITEFGRRLENLTKEKGMTDAKLAKRLKMAQPQLFLLKRSQMPQEKTLKKLSKALNKPVEFWLAGIAEPAGKGTVAAKGKKATGEISAKGVVSRSLNLDRVKVYLVVEIDGVQKKIQLP